MNNTIKQEEYIGEVLNDGHLSLPESIRSRMRLTPKSIVRVLLTVEDTRDEGSVSGWNLFHAMGRNAPTGQLPNASEEHDSYLYGKTSR